MSASVPMAEIGLAFEADAGEEAAVGVADVEAESVRATGSKEWKCAGAVGRSRNSSRLAQRMLPDAAVSRNAGWEAGARPKDGDAQRVVWMVEGPECDTHDGSERPVEDPCWLSLAICRRTRGKSLASSFVKIELNRVQGAGKLNQGRGSRLLRSRQGRRQLQQGAVDHDTGFSSSTDRRRRQARSRVDHELRGNQQSRDRVRTW